MASAMASAVPLAGRASIPARRTSRSAPARRASVRARAVEAPANLERVRITTPWEDAQITLKEEFGMTEAEIAAAGELTDEDLNGAYETMQLCRDFENECNQAYMAGKIRGFMPSTTARSLFPRCSAMPSARPTSSTRTTATTATRWRAASTRVR